MTKKAPLSMTRTEAAEALDAVRRMLAGRRTPQAIEQYLEEQHQLPPLTACRGDAHSNPYVDNCGVCAPRWGWVGERATIR